MAKAAQTGKCIAQNDFFDQENNEKQTKNSMKETGQ